MFYLLSAVGLAVFFTLNTRAATITVRRSYLRKDTTELSAVDPLALTIIALSAGSLVMLFASLLLETSQVTSVQWSPALLGWLFASAIIGTAARFWLQTYAQSLTTQTSGAVMLILEPIWVALFAAVWFLESLSALQVVGCMVIFLALLINRWQMLRSIFKRRGF